MIAVVCPTRGRPKECARMVESALQTSESDVLLYTDKDDPHSREIDRLSSQRVRVWIGEPVGRGAAVNSLCLSTNYHAYLTVSDDIAFTRQGWDEDISQAMDEFKDDIGLVHLAGSNTQQKTGEPWVNWACVSKKWVETLGWFNYPECRWFCQDTVLQVLAESLGRITRIDQVALHHYCIDHPEMREHMMHDAERFLWFCAKDFGVCLKKLKAVMA